ncbi:MAG TPA: M20/M25/M40 family metallo-hydrolase, partial [Pyrinomonadaceae bacterium]|nr:M20/M25/M40 family metallo-hydrolase [Pyrinomonadaceae bacterium]
VAFAAAPDGDDPHGRFTRFADLRFRAAAARAAGARALVLVAREENFKDDRLARLSYDNAGDAGLPVVVVSRQAAARILGLGGTSQLAEFEQNLRTAKTSTLPSSSSTATTPPTSSTTTTPATTTPASASAIQAQALTQVRPRAALTIATDVVRREAPAHNVVGILHGTDPKLKDEAILVGAHYDHLGRGGQGSLAAREGDVHHGADDNASGTAALLELARLLAGERARLRRTVVFVAFGGEEEGLLGSKHYAEHPAHALDATAAMINMDMVGRLRDEKLMVAGVGTAAEWRDLVERANANLSVKVNAAGADASSGAREGTPIVVATNGQVVATAKSAPRFALSLSEDGFGPSDHSSFYAKRVPVLFLFTGTHEDYHKPSDTAERINYEGLARITSFVRRIAYELQDAERRPTFTTAKVEATARSTGFRVYLGTVPSYGESTDGMRLAAVREGSPAEKAGLREGDKIVRLAGREVRNVYDYTNALSEMKAGQEYEAEVVRDGARLTLKITPAARK